MLNGKYPNSNYMDFITSGTPILIYPHSLILPESDRDRKYALLRGIEIFTAKEIYTTWTMYNRNGEVDRQYTHTVKHGFVENERDGRLALYMLPEDSEPGDASIDLIVELSQYCGFNENGENAVLLSRILAERDTSNIERYLSRNGISFEPAGEDADTGGKSCYPKGESSRVLSASYIMQTNQKRRVEAGCCTYPSIFGIYEMAA